MNRWCPGILVETKKGVMMFNPNPILSNFCVLSIFSVLALMSFSTLAQDEFKPPSIDDESTPSLKIQLPLPEYGEQFVAKAFDGVTSDSANRIAIKKFGYFLRPVMVQVISKDGRPLNVSIVKKHWKDVVREGVTERGSLELSFQTAIEFGVIVDAPESGVPFRIVLSAGKETIPESNLFFDPSRKIQRGV